MRIQTRFCCAPAAIDRPVILLLAIAVAGLIFTRPSAFAETLTRQVRIEARIVEVTDVSKRQLGVDMRIANVLAALPPDASRLFSPQATTFGLGASPSAGVVNQRLFPEDAAPGIIKLSGLLTSPQYDAILKVLEDDKNTKVFSQPGITVPNNQPATVHFIPSASFSNTPVILNVIPSISPDQGAIVLSVVPQTPTTTGLAEDQREPPTTVMIGEVPVLSGLFSKPSKPKQNLIVFLTAQPVDVLSHSPGGKEPEKIKVETTGTGETIGHVADLKLQNLSNGSLVIVIPPLVLESKGGKNQDYICPHEQEVALAAGQAETVPLDGVCIDRNKPPVGNGVSGALVINTIDQNIEQHPDCHIPVKAAGDLVRICTSIYEAVDTLRKDGALKDFPYKDEKEQQEILEQWCVWTNPRICEIAKTPPATKDDMKKVVYKQIEEKGTPSRNTRKKIDKGIDTIFEKVELTTEKAKDLEKPDSAAQTKSAG